MRSNKINGSLVLLLSVFLLVTLYPNGLLVDSQSSELDLLRFKVIESPNTGLVAMQTEVTDVLPDLIRTGDIEKLYADGFLVTQNIGFHLGLLTYNIRPDQSYRRSVAYWPFADAEFRHALFHSFDQLGIIIPMYGYIVTPVRSIVPPAQSKYFNPGVPEHPFNPGNPFTSTAGDGSSVGILKAAGYTFQDLGSTGVVDDADYWKCPGGADMPYLEIWTPLIVCCMSPTPSQEWMADLAEIGLAATTANGNKGIISLGRDFNDYLEDVYDRADFDAYVVYHGLERLPGQLYTWLHSSQDCLLYPGRGNTPGVNDLTIDELSEIIKFSLDTDSIEAAAKQLQEMLYTPDYNENSDNFALAYMTYYSRSYFNTYNPNLRGIVKSPGYGSANSWTFLNINWQPGTERLEDGREAVVWTQDSIPVSFNPLYAKLACEWEILSRSYDGLTIVKPYNHYDVQWLSPEWTITENATGMDIDFTLRDDIFWHDGKQFTAYDVKFCLEFLRDYQVPRYAGTWQTLIDVSVTNATHLTIHADKAGLDLFYDYSHLAAMLPEHIWNRFGDPTDPVNRQAVLDYDPAESYNVAPGYTAGPTPTPTNLLGTGPWIFQFYDEEELYADLWRNEDYFMTSVEVQNVLEEMFWQVGDYNKDGIINIIDITFVSFAYGCIDGSDPCYDVDADFNSDGIVDMRDLYNAEFHLLWQREHP